MLKKVLIAAQGEFAIRATRTLREMGIASVAAYAPSEVDEPYVKYADEAVAIDATTLQNERYWAAIVRAAETTGADGVHPGYAIPAESEEFARACERAGLRWIGPTPEHIRLLGNKVHARQVFAESGFPMLPAGELLTTQDGLLASARKIGYPVILKPACGAAGMGIRLAKTEDDVIAAYSAAVADAAIVDFNGAKAPGIYVEKYLEQARHIEIQVIGDGTGNCAHVGTRECSMQRRRQKIIEEAPFLGIKPEVREDLYRRSLDVVRRLGYRSLGTVECLLDAKGDFYFMEMNPRIQVEHGVSELVTGLDLVREQVRIASGEKLSFERAPETHGHAIELRILAEDPNTFAASSGTVTKVRLPAGPGVRMDAHVEEGLTVKPGIFGRILAKLMVHASDRKQAVARARRCVDEFVIEGITTNLPLHRRILHHPDFERGDYHTDFISRLLGEQ